MTEENKAKRAAGRRAAEFVEDGMTLGLGTGSTVLHTLERIGERIREEGLSVRGVPTSLGTEEISRGLGIPLVDLGEAGEIDLTIDGADEIDPDFNLIKGGGGALLREKVVASVSRREVIVVDRAKLVERLGAVFLLPVEVVPFAHATVTRELMAIGAAPTLRMSAAAQPFRTDNGNEILDCSFEGGIADPAGLERRLCAIPGIVETGLFIGLAHAVVIAGDDGTVEVRERPADASA